MHRHPLGLDKPPHPAAASSTNDRKTRRRPSVELKRKRPLACPQLGFLAQQMRRMRMLFRPGWRETQLHRPTKPRERVRQLAESEHLASTYEDARDARFSRRRRPSTAEPAPVPEYHLPATQIARPAVPSRWQQGRQHPPPRIKPPRQRQRRTPDVVRPTSRARRPPRRSRSRRDERVAAGIATASPVAPAATPPIEARWPSP